MREAVEKLCQNRPARGIVCSHLQAIVNCNLAELNRPVKGLVSSHLKASQGFEFGAI